MILKRNIMHADSGNISHGFFFLREKGQRVRRMIVELPDAINRREKNLLELVPRKFVSHILQFQAHYIT